MLCLWVGTFFESKLIVQWGDLLLDVFLQIKETRPYKNATLIHMLNPTMVYDRRIKTEYQHIICIHNFTKANKA